MPVTPTGRHGRRTGTSVTPATGGGRGRARGSVRLAPPERAEGPHTNYRCTRCGSLVAVMELPAPFLDPDGFVGACCLIPKEEG